jgi:hypothetical protein
MAKALKKTLQQAQKMGRGRDTILAHITPEEARLLKARGGAGTRNPRTGLPEFWSWEESSLNPSNWGSDDDDDNHYSSDTYDGTFVDPRDAPGSGANSFTGGGGTKYNTEETYGDRGGGGGDSGGDDSGSNTSDSSNSNNPTTTTTTTAAPVPIQDQIRNELKGWGGTTEQIDKIIQKLSTPDRLPNGDPGPGNSVADLETLLDNLKNVPQEDRIIYLIDNFGNAVTNWGGAGGTQAIPLNDATRASELQKPQEQRLQEAVDLQVLGSSTGEGLTKNADGSFTDPDTNITYYRGDDGKLTDRDGNVRYDPGTGLADRIDADQGRADTLANTLYGPGVNSITSQLQTQANDYDTFVSDTVDSLDDPANDFALQVGGALQTFLNGVNGQKGFLAYQKELLGAGDTYKQQMGVLSQQYDDAYAQNQGDINRLRGDYASMTETYAKELNPLRNELGDVRDRLGRVSQGQMNVARDASDRAYYNRLRDTLYADATDNIGRQTEAGMDSIRQNFAASGADPTSPAFIAAMKDLQQGRSDAMVSARRQAILDSYGLGGQMLGQRSQALSGAGAAIGAEGNAIGAEMGALGNLYGVKSQGLQADAALTGQQMQNRLAGLNTRGDMIGQLYNIGANNAQLGMQGLNTVLNTKLQGINTSADQFYKNIGLTNDLYRSNMDVTAGLGNAIGSGLNYYSGQADKNFNTLLEANQGAKSDAFSFAQLENWFNENKQEMPDFLEQYRPSSR